MSDSSGIRFVVEPLQGSRLGAKRPRVAPASAAASAVLPWADESNPFGVQGWVRCHISGFKVGGEETDKVIEQPEALGRWIT